MTGYGKAVITYKEKKINVEIKSLNSKALDLSTRIAPLYREKEMEMRQMVSTALVRGKVDLNVWIEKDAGADATPINSALVENYYRQIRILQRKWDSRWHPICCCLHSCECPTCSPRPRWKHLPTRNGQP
jgi:uncharacterized protein YicC (UPF0701 family)